MHIRDILIPGGKAKLPGDYERQCNCHRCQTERASAKGFPESMERIMSVCPKCKSKRCAKAADHRSECDAPLTDAEIKHRGQYEPLGVHIGPVMAGKVTEIVVLGTPLGKPRMTRRDKWKKRPCVMRYREWADKVRAAAGTVPPAERVKSLSWVATFEPPASWSKKRWSKAIGTLHQVKPDRDNLDKGILDILYPRGDQAIAHGTITKRWGLQARLVIRIEEV
jgi:Holliday junction resolvase RusA-like endonuclease